MDRILTFWISLLALLATSSALAQDQGWVLLSQTESLTYEGRAGSFERSLTSNTNEPVGAIIVRVRNKSTNRIVFEKNYVTLSDCTRGYGKLVTTELNGRALYQTDFIVDGGTVASTLAATICSLATPASSQDLIPSPATPAGPAAKHF